MNHPPSHDYDRQQADLVARIRDHRAKLARPTVQPLPSDGGAGIDAKNLVAAMLLVALFGGALALVTVWTQSAPMVAAVSDDDGGVVP